MTFCVLHISDLHRSPEEPISNAELVSALLADIDRWADDDPSIAAPDAIVVTGDLVRGVRIGTPDPSSALASQYNDAHDFLDRLTARLLDGDRTRVVIVPGNHDVNWHVARSAMEVADPSALGELDFRRFSPESDLRWDWATRQVFRIVDRELYDSRFDLFNQTVNNFYGAEIYNRDTYFHTFELLAGRVAIVGFNSCFGNDCFARHGAIPEVAIADAHLEVRTRGFDLVAGAWHHNVEGGPFASDYMDVETVYRLIAKGFRVGMHGHQHRAEAGHRFIRLPEQEPMALISAGSLCAGWRELPAGVNRQYNVIEFADDLRSASVHVREAVVATAFAASRRAEFGGKSFVEMRWATLTERATGKSEAETIRRANAVMEAEQTLRHGDAASAVDRLISLNPEPGSFEHDLLMEALLETRRWDLVEETMANPRTPGELVLRVRALVEQRRFLEARQLVSAKPAPEWLNDALRQDLLSRIQAEAGVHP